MRKIIARSLYVVALVALIPAVSSAALFFMSDQGYFGLGNTDPQHRLDVSGAIYSRLVTISSTTIDWNDGNIQSLNLDGDKTLYFVNGKPGGEYKLILSQDSVGGRAVTWPSSVVWPAATTPVLSSASSSVDLISFVNSGNGYLGSYNLNYTANSLYDGLVSYWSLNNDSSDQADSNDGSDANITYSSGNGKIGIGAGFNGSSSKINFGNSSSLQLASTFSISFWLKLASVSPGGAYAIVTKTDDSSQRSYGIWYNNPSSAQGLVMQVSSNGSDPNTYSWVSNNSAANPGDTNWHHYVLMFTPNGGSPIITVYKDGSNVTSASGALQSSQSWSGTSIFNSSSNFVIGDKTNGGWPLSGALDEVGVWNRLLTSTEISSLYKSGAGLQFPF